MTSSQENNHLFKQHYNAAHLVTSRYFSLAVLFVLIVFAVWDILSLGINHPVIPELLLIRFTFTLPAIILTFYLSFFPKKNISQDILVTTTCLVTTLSITALHWKFYEIGHPLNLDSIILCMVGIYFLPNIFSFQKIFVGGALIISYFIYLYATDHNLISYVHSGIYLGSINLAGLIHSLDFDKQRRANFDKTEFLKQLALTDQLTGAENRHKFDDHFVELLNQARKENKGIAIAITDIDFFKQYNDTYGHLSGDKCLIEVVHTLLGMKQHPLDRCIRFGGEEFILIKYDITLEESKKWGQHIIQSIYQLNIPHESSKIDSRVTTSAGLIHWNPNSSLNRTELMKRADEALYKAKNNGRNQVQFSHD